MAEAGGPPTCPACGEPLGEGPACPRCGAPCPPAEAPEPPNPAVSAMVLLALLTLGAAVALALRPLPAPPPLARAPRPARPAADAGPERPRVALAQLAIPSIATLRCPGSQGVGFFVGPDRLLTCAHVLCDQVDTLEVDFPDGRQLLGDLVQRDEALDLALVRVVGANATPLPLGDASRLQPGERVLLGSAEGPDFSYREAHLQAVGVSTFGLAYLQVSGGVGPGSSGGPLLDARGRAVGVVSMALTGEGGAGLALPINYAREVYPPLVPREGDEPASAAWTALAERARAEQAGEEEAVSRSLRAPGLFRAGGRWVAGPAGRAYRLEAQVLLRSAELPELARLDFRVERPGQPACPLAARAVRWERFHPGPGALPDGGGLVPRAVRWVEQHELADLYTARVELDPAPCGPAGAGLDLVLEQADPQAARQPVRSW